MGNIALPAQWATYILRYYLIVLIETSFEWLPPLERGERGSGTLGSLLQLFAVRSSKCKLCIVRQVDFDGKTSFSPVRKVQFAGAASAALTAAPVPFSAEVTFTVRVSKAQPATQFTFTDATGRVVLKRQLDVPAGTSQLPLAGLDVLPAGLYRVQTVLDGQLVHLKVIKR
jgi:hypothetical protein